MTSEDADRGAPPGEVLRIGARVRVAQGEGHGFTGTIVEDFGDSVGVPVAIGDVHVVDAARRWAVAIDHGGLRFLDSEHLTIV